MIEHAQLALIGAMHYPDDPPSAHHYFTITAIDCEAQRRGLMSDLSHVGALLQTDAQKRKRQGAIAGFTVLAMAELKASNLPVSLSRAQDLVFEKGNFLRRCFDPKLPTSKRSIREHFDQYKNASHFWAASIAFPDEFEDASRSSIGLEQFLRISGAVQGLMQSLIEPNKVKLDLLQVPDKFMDGSVAIGVPSLTKQWRVVAEGYSKRGGN